MVVILLGCPSERLASKKSLAQLIERGPPPKDEVVAVLDLGEEQPMLTAGLLALAFFKKRGQSSQPFLSATQ